MAADQTLVSRQTEASVTKKFRELLLFGNRKEALEWAMTQGLLGPCSLPVFQDGSKDLFERHDPLRQRIGVDGSTPNSLSAHVRLGISFIFFDALQGDR